MAWEELKEIGVEGYRDLEGSECSYRSLEEEVAIYQGS